MEEPACAGSPHANGAADDGRRENVRTAVAETYAGGAGVLAVLLWLM